ncbi:hypothetical protein PACTADRAFT_34970 [Pachysolen tannophilus NRRL Y-2460]|uniref:Vanadate resistance protein n=1 Tax=Pachysolen tannophilus NRRL Y-2460 TaxID=669874 RepID=A0A1E4TQY2_PACTA|nr:hypothetical protein PACTADRAFT_34970 [Pachysolen tannophilus NRRL Y-2460]
MRILRSHGKKTDLPFSQPLYPKKKSGLSSYIRYKNELYKILGVIVVIFFIYSIFKKSNSEIDARSSAQELDDLLEAKLHSIADDHRHYTVTKDGVIDNNEDSSNKELEENSLGYDVEFYDLNYYQADDSNGEAKDDVILLCIPLRDAEPILPLMFRNLMNLTYSHSLIDLAFLVSDCSDGDQTLQTLFEYSVLLQNGTLLDFLDKEEELKKLEKRQGSKDLYLKYMEEAYVNRLKNAFQPPYHQNYTKPFRSVEIYNKDFGQVIGQGFSDRHDVKVQGIRRKLMGRSRNWLVSAALKPYHSWVYWRDADIETSPGEIIQDLMKHVDFDVIVPNVWRPLPTFLGNEQPYDLNSWIESEAALQLASTLGEDDVIVEGYAEYPTWRAHLAYIREPEGNINECIDLDGVGGVSILAKAKVFRSGVNFPAFTFMNHAETEGFGKMARKMGFRVGGLPHYTIWHVYEPSDDDLKSIGKLERKNRRLLRRTKKKTISE